MSRLPKAYDGIVGRPTRRGREAAAFRGLRATGICGRGSVLRNESRTVCPVWFPVPPEAYGGTERVVALLADGLVDADHEVTLFASGDSQTRARLESVFHTAPSEWIGHTYWEMQHAMHAFLKADEFDVVHDHTGMLGLAFGGLIDTPFCHTVHGPLDGQPGRMYEQVLELAPTAKLISISMNQRKPKPHLPWIANCPNALDLSMYPFRRKPGATTSCSSGA